MTQLAAEEQPYDKYSARVTRFIEDCVYGVTTNDKKQLSRRIAEPYTVYIDCEDKDFAAKILDRVLTIGAATGLKPSVAPLQEAATMHIYIKPAAELMRLDTPYVRNIDLKTGRYYHLWWDESCNITKANIYLVSNAFRNDDARIVAFTWACMAAFGLNGSSKEFKDTNMNPTNTSPEFTHWTRSCFAFSTSTCLQAQRFRSLEKS